MQVNGRKEKLDRFLPIELQKVVKTFRSIPSQ